MLQMPECPARRRMESSSQKCARLFLIEGADLELVLPRRGRGGSLKDFYGLKVEIPVKRLWVINFGWTLGRDVSWGCTLRLCLLENHR